MWNKDKTINKVAPRRLRHTGVSSAGEHPSRSHGKDSALCLHLAQANRVKGTSGLAWRRGQCEEGDALCDVCTSVCTGRLHTKVVRKSLWHPATPSTALPRRNEKPRRVTIATSSWQACLCLLGAGIVSANPHAQLHTLLFETTLQSLNFLKISCEHVSFIISSSFWVEQKQF